MSTHATTSPHDRPHRSPQSQILDGASRAQHSTGVMGRNPYSIPHRNRLSTRKTGYYARRVIEASRLSSHPRRQILELRPSTPGLQDRRRLPTGRDYSTSTSATHGDETRGPSFGRRYPP